MSSSNDPLELSGLDPKALQLEKERKNAKPPSELEQAKEARLAMKEQRLAAVGAARAPPATKAAAAPSATPPPPKEIDKSSLLDKIAAYRERFPHLKKRNTLNAKSSTEEILDELHYIEMQLGSSTKSGISTQLFIGAMIGIERSTDYWNPLGLNLTGLGAVAQQNIAEFQPLLDELMIKYNAGTYTSVETRLVLTIGATVLTVHAANSNPETARAVKKMAQGFKEPSGAEDL